MNCDQVFDVLTRGPFPNGSPDDVPAERHLAGCSSCRRLADALRPAVELLHESLELERTTDLPGYWGDLFETEPEATPRIVPASLAERTTRHPAPPTTPPRRPLVALGTSVAAVLLGTLLAVLIVRATTGGFFGSSLEARSNAGTIDLAKLIERVQPCRPGTRLLTGNSHGDEGDVASQTPPADPAHSPLPVAAVTYDSCCLNCHAPARPTHLSPASIVRLQESCLACHHQSPQLDAMF